MKKIILFSFLTALSISAQAADFTVQLTPADALVNDQQVGIITTAKISNWATAFASLFTSSLKAPNV